MTFCPATNGQKTVMDLTREILFTVPVSEPDGEIKGIATAMDIVGSLGRGEDPATTTAGELAREALTIGPGASLDEACDLLPEHGGTAVVVDDGEVIGYVELAQIRMFVESIAELGEGAGPVITEVSPQDTLGAQLSRGGTVAAGVSALRCIRQAMTAAGKQQVTNLLDFPSGHGRILRVLKAAFPEAKLTAGELDRDGVDFCARTFGAVPVYSTERPEEITLGDDFDLIWCGSLLTHVNADRWPGFLSLFSRHLTLDGVLVFTASGPRLRDHMILRRFALQSDQADQVLREFDRDGFAYSNYPGSDNYGISLASPDWVREKLGVAGLRLVDYVETGWDAPPPRQDVYSCVRD